MLLTDPTNPWTLVKRAVSPRPGGGVILILEGPILCIPGGLLLANHLCVLFSHVQELFKFIPAGVLGLILGDCYHIFLGDFLGFIFRGYCCCPSPVGGGGALRFIPGESFPLILSFLSMRAHTGGVWCASATSSLRFTKYVVNKFCTRYSGFFCS